MHIPSRLGLSALTLAVLLSVSACDKAPSGEAAATVNGEAISLPQLNRELDKLGKLDPDQTKQAANKLLRNMVDQALLAQKATAEKLDQTPAVKLALEAARRQILAEAAVEKLTAGVAKPGDQEISEYFNKHPELFAERRLYRLQELSIQVTPENTESVKAQLAGAANLNDFVQWLKAQNIPARVNQTVKGAEQLPAQLLPRLAQMKEGQAMTMSVPGAFNVLVVAGSQLQPVSLDQAKSSIERFLLNQKKREVAAAALKELRTSGKVEYLGAYTDAGKESAQAEEPAAAQQALPGASAEPQK